MERMTRCRASRPGNVVIANDNDNETGRAVYSLAHRRGCRPGCWSGLSSSLGPRILQLLWFGQLIPGFCRGPTAGSEADSAPSRGNAWGGIASYPVMLN